MRFLKTIQRRESERPAGADETAAAVIDAPVYSPNEPPGFLALPELRIGTPQPSTPVSSPANGIHSKTLLPEYHRHADSFATDAAASVTAPPFIREIAVNAESVNQRLVSITQPRSPFCEEYRNMRTQLLHRSKKRKLQAIVITSVGPSEGKSVTAMNLSWLFAQADGMRVLVIDSDLRRPSLAEYVGLQPDGDGLSELLSVDAPLMEKVIRLQPAGLYLLPGGYARDDVADLLSGPRFADILAEAREHFDFIIIDAPPLGIFTDASLLMNLSDGAILVVRAGKTKYKDVDRILDSLPRERMLGTVLNHSDEPRMVESYYRYGFYDREESTRA